MKEEKRWLESRGERVGVFPLTRKEYIFLKNIYANVKTSYI